MKNIELIVPAIHCSHCVHTIKMELSDMDGVEKVNVDLNSKRVSVSYKSPASEMKIRDLLADINYPAEK